MAGYRIFERDHSQDFRRMGGYYGVGVPSGRNRWQSISTRTEITSWYLRVSGKDMYDNDWRSKLGNSLETPCRRSVFRTCLAPDSPLKFTYGTTLLSIEYAWTSRHSQHGLPTNLSTKDRNLPLSSSIRVLGSQQTTSNRVRINQPIYVPKPLRPSHSR
jgi:hypothetical protein